MFGLFWTVEAKGQIKPKADWRVLDSSKNKQEDLFFFAMKSKKAKKKKLIRFLGESIVRQSAL